MWSRNFPWRKFANSKWITSIDRLIDWNISESVIRSLFVFILRAKFTFHCIIKRNIISWNYFGEMSLSSAIAARGIFPSQLLSICLPYGQRYGAAFLLSFHRDFSLSPASALDEKPVQKAKNYRSRYLKHRKDLLQTRDRVMDNLKSHHQALRKDLQELKLVGSLDILNWSVCRPLFFPRFHSIMEFCFEKKAVTVFERIWKQKKQTVQGVARSIDWLFRGNYRISRLMDWSAWISPR